MILTGVQVIQHEIQLHKDNPEYKNPKVFHHVPNTCCYKYAEHNDHLQIWNVLRHRLLSKQDEILK